MDDEDDPAPDDDDDAGVPLDATDVDAAAAEEEMTTTAPEDDAPLSPENDDEESTRPEDAVLVPADADQEDAPDPPADDDATAEEDVPPAVRQLLSTQASPTRQSSSVTQERVSSPPLAGRGQPPATETARSSPGRHGCLKRCMPRRVAGAWACRKPRRIDRRAADVGRGPG